jgi:hypothetical protein
MRNQKKFVDNLMIETNASGRLVILRLACRDISWRQRKKASGHPAGKGSRLKWPAGWNERN